MIKTKAHGLLCSSEKYRKLYVFLDIMYTVLTNIS